MTSNQPRIAVKNLTTTYDERVISKDLSLEIPEGGFSVIIGPNACGKSTLLRSIARIHKHAEGSVVLDGRDIHSMKSKELAQQLGLLPQSAVAPEKMRVRDLVARGRSPHQGLFRQWSREDHRAVQEAMELTRITALADRSVDELSGGQRQRVWLALVLAQDTPTVLLDEPTTYLDLSHQVDILELCRRMYEQQQRTVVAVLHDLNLATRYATHLVVMKDGAVVAQGHPHEVMTAQLMEDVFNLPSLVIEDPITSTPLVIPRRPDN
ncbi:ATP-binding cassette domain-containing protein [Corynebacterium sp. zg254]|uniref:ABC transporter ATP-binding protein n=1 Tax=Corynebacterium zhongnanshanii TaxID=2768834 RepID=A0ABQ6VBQ0_9CORY|nr:MULTISPECIES: ABC transporter ATP-binding protein [Corynebacterium]KAB3519138.1 ABC transporter ATP-binding protein [Corynebacterium zhongnanshanii]MCR5914977.1 ATP-binding cassette domain-containing protein [Corynebacterium sp. zg254]